MDSFQGRLDTALERETPEGIALELRPAGVPARVAAFLIDLAIRGSVLLVLAIAMQFLEDMGVGFFLLALFLVEWFYPVVFELGRHGATPGKRALGLKVVMDTGLPVTPGASLARNLLRVADFMPLVYGFGLVCMLLRTDFRRLGDIAAGTLVVHQSPRPLRGELPQVQPRPPAISMGPREQGVLVMLAARAPTLTGERLHELAALAAPAAGEEPQPGNEALTDKVLGVAQWLLGRRA
jgi:uncharacterized RDD family membrane protein YckC